MQVTQRPFFSAPLAALFASAVLSVAATGAIAQTAPAISTTNPTTVGVTPQDASEAMDKAVPRSDTATVVRTDEPAAKAAEAAKAVKATAPAAATTTLRRDNTVAPSTPRKTPRAPRADRN